MDPFQTSTQAVPEWLRFIVEAATGLGTLLLAALAIWGDSAKAFFIRPKMQLTLRSIHGECVKIDNCIMMFFHLKLTNLRRLAVPDCRVILKGLTRADASGAFIDEPLAMDLQLPWAPHLPRSLEPRERKLVRNLTVDFLRLRQGENRVELRLYDRIESATVDIRGGERVRYRVAVESPDATPKEVVFEVVWNGQWDADPRQLARYLVISEV